MKDSIILNGCKKIIYVRVNMINNKKGLNFFKQYAVNLNDALKDFDYTSVFELAESVGECWKNKKNIFICGNGGSAGNAVHLANDFIYGIAKERGCGAKATALPANSSVLTCLANDLGYKYIYSEQLSVLGSEGDILIVLSGSGNSTNIIEVLRVAKEMNVKSFAVLGFDGGEAKKISDQNIHFDVHDMQIAEDLQLVVGHMVMKWLYLNKKKYLKNDK